MGVVVLIVKFFPKDPNFKLNSQYWVLMVCIWGSSTFIFDTFITDGHRSTSYLIRRSTVLNWYQIIGGGFGVTVRGLRLDPESRTWCWRILAKIFICQINIKSLCAIKYSNGGKKSTETLIQIKSALFCWIRFWLTRVGQCHRQGPGHQYVKYRRTRKSCKFSIIFWSSI